MHLATALTGHGSDKAGSFEEYVAETLAGQGPGGMVLAGWNAPPYCALGPLPTPYSLDALEGLAADGAEKLAVLTDAYFELIEGKAPADLLRGGRQRPFINTAMAAAVMYYEKQNALGETPKLGEKLRKLVHGVGLVAHPTQAHDLLVSYGAVIYTSFRLKNADVLSRAADSGGVYAAEAVQQLTRAMEDMHRATRSALERNAVLLRHQSTQIDELQGQIVRLEKLASRGLPSPRRFQAGSTSGDVNSGAAAATSSSADGSHDSQAADEEPADAAAVAASAEGGAGMSPHSATAVGGPIAEAAAAVAGSGITIHSSMFLQPPADEDTGTGTDADARALYEDYHAGKKLGLCKADNQRLKDILTFFDAVGSEEELAIIKERGSKRNLAKVDSNITLLERRVAARLMLANYNAGLPIGVKMSKIRDTTGTVGGTHFAFNTIDSALKEIRKKNAGAANVRVTLGNPVDPAEIAWLLEITKDGVGIRHKDAAMRPPVPCKFVVSAAASTGPAESDAGAATASAAAPNAATASRPATFTTPAPAASPIATTSRPAAFTASVAAASAAAIGSGPPLLPVAAAATVSTSTSSAAVAPAAASGFAAAAAAAFQALFAGPPRPGPTAASPSVGAKRPRPGASV